MDRQVAVGGQLAELERELVAAFLLGHLAEERDLGRVGQAVGEVRGRRCCCGRRG